MSFFVKSTLAALSVATLASSPASAVGPIVFDFEGIAPYTHGSTMQIGNFYAGMNAVFESTAVVYCLNTFGVDCPTTAGPTPVGNKWIQSLATAGTASRDGNPQGPQQALRRHGALLPGPSISTPSDFNGFAIRGPSAYINFTNPAGIKSQVSFIYVSLNQQTFVSVYDGFNGTGVLLGSTILLPNAAIGGCPAYNAIRCPFDYGLLAFAGAGRSITFANSEDLDVIIDDLTVSIPEPASWALMIAGFGMVGGALRRRRTGALTA